RRYHQSHESYFAVVFGGWIELGAIFVFLCFSVMIVVGLAKWFPRRWWLPGATAFVGLAALFTFISPYLIGPTHPLRDPDLRAAAKRIADKGGVNGAEVRAKNVATKDRNEYTIGIGPTRKVVLWDSLLDGRFTNRQVEVVLAHEYGHQARNHLLKGIAWYALFAFPGTYLIAVAARRPGGAPGPPAVPVRLPAPS